MKNIFKKRVSTEHCTVTIEDSVFAYIFPFYDLKGIFNRERTRANNSMYWKGCEASALGAFSAFFEVGKFRKETGILPHLIHMMARSPHSRRFPSCTSTSLTI